MILDNKTLLAKCVTLLFRESLLGGETNASFEVVKTVVDEIKVEDANLGNNLDKNILLGLKSTILDMIQNFHEIEPSTLLEQLRLNTENDRNLYTALKDALTIDLNEGSLRKSIVVLRRQLDTHFREKKIADMFRKMSAQINFKREEIKDLSQAVQEFWAQLEPLTMKQQSRDPAIVSMINLGKDNEDTYKEYRKVTEVSSDSRVYKTLWHGFNEMTQGGLRVQATMHHALPHRYKSSFNMTLFSQVLRANRPFTKDPKKIPCMVRISFEDEMDNMVKFMFLQMKYSETREYVNIKDYEPEFILKYVMDAFRANGWEVFLMRVDPTKWTYLDVFNFIIQLESDGYAVEGLWIDYLAMLPTTGCVQGAQGEALRDMLRRFRNFCIPKGILFVTPHQMSTEAKVLLRGQTTDANFVKDVAERGYAAGSKQLDHELDLEIYQHIAKVGKKAYLTVQRGKHRLPTIIGDDQKFFALEFTHSHMPIPDDRDTDKILRRIGKSSDTDEADANLLEL